MKFVCLYIHRESFSLHFIQICNYVCNYIQILSIFLSVLKVKSFYMNYYEYVICRYYKIMAEFRNALYI